ncbi:MAG: hypothetical protein QOI20_554 [Acidimicrobiaceae bacterium]|jgi:hypothetical protein|nr:hypothetical protein [Acidimicrobiaceae bacterium]
MVVRPTGRAALTARSREAWLEVVLRHVPRLGDQELQAAYEAEYDAIDLADEEVPHRPGSITLQQRMTEIDDLLRPLVSHEAYALYIERIALAMAAESMHGDQPLALGMILGAGWQHRVTFASLYEWQMGEPLPALVAVRFDVDHRAAVVAAREAAYDNERVREIIEAERTSQKRSVGAQPDKGVTE